jgi:FkbM family methyltransferase
MLSQGYVEGLYHHAFLLKEENTKDIVTLAKDMYERSVDPTKMLYEAADELSIDCFSYKIIIEASFTVRTKQLLLSPIQVVTDEFRFMDQIIKSSMAIIDLGAKVGTYSLFFANKVYPSGRVYSIESQPALVQLLEKTIERNPRLKDTIRLYTHTKTVHSNISNSELSVDSSVNQNISDDHKITDSASMNSTIVKDISLDELWEQEGQPEIHLIRIDEENNDHLRVLKGSSNLILHSYPMFILQGCQGGSEAGKELFSYLQEIGYDSFYYLPELNGLMRIRSLLQQVSSSGSIVI